jgi:TolB protein
VIRRALGLAGAVLAALAVASTAIADAPAGPRLAFLQLNGRPTSLAITTSDPALREQAVVAGGGLRIRPLPFPFSVPAWSPDGSLIAFSGIPGPLPGLLQPQSRRLYIVGPNGADLRAIPGTRGGFDPVFSPDGTTLAFAKTVNKRRHGPGAFGVPRWKGVTTWSIGLDGRRLHQLTRWRNGVEDLPSSFSPDGAVLALTHRDLFGDRADALALRLDNRSSYVLSKNAAWPRYSPDGSRIAFLGVRRVGDTSCCESGDGFSVDLYTMSANDSSRRRLTDTPAKAERPASWDPSGERLAYTTKSEPTLEASGDLEAAVMEINADGSCPSRLSAPVPGTRARRIFLFSPTWQPGPGRGAGRIAC